MDYQWTLTLYEGSRIIEQLVSKAHSAAVGFTASHYMYRLGLILINVPVQLVFIIIMTIMILVSYWMVTCVGIGRHS